MTNFTQRILTGIVLIAIMVFAVLMGRISFLILVLLINLLCLNEFYNLFRASSPNKMLGLFLSLTMFISFILFNMGVNSWFVLFASVPIVFSIFVSELFSESENPFTRLAFTFLGVLYVTIPCIFLANLAFLPFTDNQFHPQFILGFFIMVWASDSGAYGSGRLLGKHPLFLRISPKKTWEGSFGGALSTFIVAYLISFFFNDLDRSDWLILAGIVIVAGTLGDLIKSMMKRSLGIKDSGTALPGHGGFLDRFDAMLGSAPFVFCYILIFS